MYTGPRQDICAAKQPCETTTLDQHHVEYIQSTAFTSSLPSIPSTWFPLLFLHIIITIAIALNYHINDSAGYVPIVPHKAVAEVSKLGNL